MKKSVAVLGLGKYGKSLAENLYNLGADVLAVDQDEALINDFSERCTAAVCANLANEDEVALLGLKNMDIVVTAMGSNLAASIMSVAVAKEQGVPVVIAKTSSERMSSILRKVGADKILNQEGEGGARSARILLSSSFKDFFELGEGLYMIEMSPKKEWIGKNLAQLQLRKSMNLNIAAVREKGGKWHHIDPRTPLAADSTLLVIMEKKTMEQWT